MAVAQGHVSDTAIREVWNASLETLADETQATDTVRERVYLTKPAHQIFVSLDYLDAIQLAAPGNVRLFVTTGDSSPGIAMAAAYSPRRGPLPSGSVPPLTPYTPFLSNADRASRELLGHMQKYYASLRVHLPPGVNEPSELEGDWQFARLATFLAPLAASDEISFEWSENRRRTVRKHSGDYTISEATETSLDDLAPKLAQLVQKSYSRHGRRTPLPPSNLAGLIRSSVLNGTCRVFAATRVNGPTEAAVAVLSSKASAWYWLAGSTPGPAMSVLIAKVLPTLHDEGIKSFDFVGANTPSIAEFKRRFGCELVEYQSMRRVRLPGSELLDRAFRVARRVVNR